MHVKTNIPHEKFFFARVFYIFFVRSNFPWNIESISKIPRTISDSSHVHRPIFEHLLNIARSLKFRNNHKSHYLLSPIISARNRTASGMHNWPFDDSFMHFLYDATITERLIYIIRHGDKQTRSWDKIVEHIRCFVCIPMRRRGKFAEFLSDFHVQN